MTVEAWLRRVRKLRAAVAILLLIGTQLAAREPPPSLEARPSAVADTLAPGLTDLGDGALAYRPADVTKSPASLLVVLHGAGETSGAMIGRLRPAADRFGLVLLAVQSAGPTWDLIGSSTGADDPIGLKLRRSPRFGRDPKRIDLALSRLFGRIPVDGSRIAVAGFSDGASEALSIGLANPQLLGGVIAMSPGLVVLPTAGVTSQRIVITHGRRDPVLAFQVSRRDIAGLLERVGYRPTFIAFDGDHRIDAASLDQALIALFGAPPA